MNEFIDSLASKSPESELGIVLFDNNIKGHVPLKLDSASNVIALKQFIADAETLSLKSYNDKEYLNASYGTALNTAITYLSALQEGVNQAIVFAAAAPPHLSTSGYWQYWSESYSSPGVSDTTYRRMVTTGVLNTFPSIHSLYFRCEHALTEHPTQPISNPSTYDSVYNYDDSLKHWVPVDTMQWAAEDTLRHMAEITGGSFTPLKDNLDKMKTTLVDSILQKITKPVVANGFYMLNETTGQVTFGSVLDTSNSAVLTGFNEPMVLSVGANNIVLNYTREIEGETNTIASKSIVLNRDTSSVTPAEKEKFDSLFELTCYAHSKFEFADNSFTPLADGVVYDANYANVPIRLSRGPAEDGLVQACSVEVKTAKGDREIIKATETGISTNIYNAGIVIQKGTPVKNNGILEVSVFDTLYGIYENKNSLANGQYYDVSRDTVLVKYLGAVNSVVLYSSTGDPATLQPLGDTVTMTVDNPLSIWAKTFDSNNNWIGAVTGTDTIGCSWSVTPENLAGQFTNNIDSLWANNTFADTIAPRTATIFVTHPATGKKDTVTIIVKAGVATSLNIESQPNAITSAGFLNKIVPFYDSTKTVTVYSVSRDQYGNFCDTIPSVWTTYPGNSGIFTIEDSSTYAQIIRPDMTIEGVDSLKVSDASGKLPSDSVKVQLYSWHYDSIEIRVRISQDSTVPYHGGTMNTGQEASLEAWGRRNTDGVFTLANVVWSLDGLVDENVQGGTGATFTFRPKSPNSGSILATKTQTGYPPFVGRADMIVTPEPPTKYMIIPGKTQTSAGDTLYMAVQAYNSDGLYPGILDTTLFWYTNQEETYPQNFYNVVQWIRGSNGTLDILGPSTSPGTANVHFINGVATVSAILTYAATTENPAILTVSDGVVKGSTPEIVITPGVLTNIQIMDEDFKFIVDDTLSNATTEGIHYFVAGLDPYANVISGTKVTWNTNGDIPAFPTSQKNPDSKAVYYTSESPGEASGYIYITEQNFKDTVKITIRDNMDAIINTVVTRDTNGNGYLDMLELHLSEDASVISNTDIAKAFTVSDDISKKTWDVVSIAPLNTRTSIFYLTLVENSTKQTEEVIAKGNFLETALLPSVTVNSSDQLETWGLNITSKSTVDGAAPVIKSAMIYDKATPQTNDDEIKIKWSELQVTGNSVTDPEDAFNMWYPDTSSQLPEYLRGCILGGFDKITMANGNRLTQMHWINADSINGGIHDRFGNYVTMNNRKVKLSFSDTTTASALPYPNPIDVTKLGNDPNSPYNPKFQVTLFGDADVSITVYDMAGNLVIKLPPRRLSGTTVSGYRGRTHIINEWNGTNGKGRKISRGGYIAKIFVKYLAPDQKPDIITCNISVQ